jgi:ABC-type oligopeptide transport system substrate-binding subunit
MVMRCGRSEVPAGFTHFDHVNPDAPKGGEIRLASNQRNSTFDKYNCSPQAVVCLPCPT